MRMRKSVAATSDPFTSFGGVDPSLPASGLQTRQEARHARAAVAGVDPAAADALRKAELKEAARVRAAKWRANKRAERQEAMPIQTRGQKAAATRAANALKASAPENMTRGQKAAFTRRMNRIHAGLPASHAGERLGPRGGRRRVVDSTETIVSPAAASMRPAAKSGMLTLPQAAIDAIDGEIASTQARLESLKRTRASVVVG